MESVKEAQCMGPEIKAARKAKGMTQADFAKALGLNRATISKYESGVVEPSVTQLKKMADVLGIPWTLLVPSDNKEVYVNADTYGLSPAEFRKLMKDGAYNDGTIKEVLRDRNTGKLMDVVVHEDGSVDASLHYIDPEARISLVFWGLNKKGKEKAAELVEMVAGNPEYQYKTSPDPEDLDDYQEDDDDNNHDKEDQDKTEPPD